MKVQLRITRKPYTDLVCQNRLPRRQVNLIKDVQVGTSTRMLPVFKDCEIKAFQKLLVC